MTPKAKTIKVHYMDRECATCLYWEVADHSIKQWGECLVTSQLTHRNSFCERWRMLHISMREKK